MVTSSLWREGRKRRKLGKAKDISELSNNSIELYEGFLFKFIYSYFLGHELVRFRSLEREVPDRVAHSKVFL